ncbi:N-alpha-acetyltransferase 50 [Nematocida sp. AWRm80]|nr:N-alpha-acetyltransferase 50 [Nematocida sp. AWRm80]
MQIPHADINKISPGQEEQPSRLPYLVVACPSMIDSIKSLNQKIFPITYPADFYKNMFKENMLTELMYSPGEDMLVGILSVKIVKASIWGTGEPNKCQECAFGKDTEDPYLYVAIFGLLEEYRGIGLGKTMLSRIKEIARTKEIHHIMLHVQVSNMKAIEFYYKQGFKLIEYIKDYYHKIFPKDAFLLRKCLCIKDTAK